MFTRCDFLLGADQAVVILIPARLPAAETYTVSVSDQDIRFRAGFRDIATLPFAGGEVLRRIMRNTQIGLVEYNPEGRIPDHITHVAYVEIRRAAS